MERAGLMTAEELARQTLGPDEIDDLAALGYVAR
jgi:hypothetical protein